MPNTLEKQLKEEILKRKQQQRKPNKKKTLIFLAILGALSLLVSLGRWQMEKSAPSNQVVPGSERQNSNGYETDTI